MTHKNELNWDDFKKNFAHNGYCLVPKIFDAKFVETCKEELTKAIELEVKYHGSREYKDYGMVLACPQYGKSFTDVFDNENFCQGLNLILDETCIVYAYTSSSLPPKATNYSHRIHVDSPRLIPGYITNIGAIIALNDFTKDNGATWFLPGSQERLEAPSESEFKAKAVQIFAKAGDVIYFNSRLWHSGGMNSTSDWRHSVTLNVCRPWMKQRLDLPKLLGDRDSSLSQTAQQKLGYHSQVPASYAEYYAPPELRKFKQKTV